MKRWLIIGIVVVVAGVGLLALRWIRTSETGPRYRTVKVERGDLVQAVKETGTVQPIKTVQVGTQVTGPVKKLYVDYNDRVHQGQMVAQVDPMVYQAQVDQGRANLQAAQANVDSTRARLIQADAELKRNQELKVRDLVSQSDLENTVANRDVLAAQVKQAEAAVEQAKATLRMSETNLAYTTIRSPVDGVVIARNVDEGQTVVGSFAPQTLFVIATDLKQIQVEADVPEADISKIGEGQPVAFSVDAYGQEEFKGAVSQVRIASATVQNVVTYKVIVKADNPDQKLRPGMSANLTFRLDQRTGVLKIPNAAFRFKPEPAEEAAPEAGAPPQPACEQSVWVRAGKQLKPVAITPGISDGSFTEVAGGPLQEGQEVVIDRLVLKTAAAAGPSNPFAPKIPTGRPAH